MTSNNHTEERVSYRHKPVPRPPRTYTATQVKALLDLCYASGVRDLPLLERSLKAAGRWGISPEAEDESV